MVRELDHSLRRERTARAEAEAANRARDEFLAVLSHELRSPLNAIVGWAHILKGEPQSPTAARAVETILRNADHQVRLMFDIADLSRGITGEARPRGRPGRRPCGARPSYLLRAVVGRYSEDPSPARYRGDSARVVQGDGARLRQVFWNLLSNAVKFSPPGGSVQASAAREGNSVVVKVVDTGQGSGAEFLPHAFESFRQEDATRTRRQGGLGLGLAIVRHITEAQGGAVDARSEGSGKGAVFTVTLPLCTEPRLETFGGGDLGRPQLAGLMVLIVRIMSKRLSVVEQKLLKKATARIRERRLAAEKLRMEGFTHAARRGKVVSSFRKKLLNRALDVAGLDGQRIEELQAADARSMDVFAKKQSQGLRQGSGATAKRLGQESRLLDGRYQALATLAPAPHDPVHLHLTTATEIRIATVQMGTPPPAFVTQIAPGRNVVNALLDVSVDHDHFGGQGMFIEWHFIATLPRAGFGKLLALITFNGACGLRIGQSCIKDGRSSA